MRYFICVLCFFICGCVSVFEPKKPFPFTELVLHPESQIIAITPAGTIRIRADNELKRTYSWDGSSRSAVLWPRRARWYGSLGAYYPGPGSHWISNNGVTRGVLEEGQMHFASTKEALEWLNSSWHKSAGAIYNDQGLFILYSKSPSRNQINVDVFQIYIAGKKPERLPGSSNKSISIHG